MDRREFVKICSTALVASTLSSTLSSVAEEVKQAKIDVNPEEFAELAYKHFIPGKLTCCESMLLAGCEVLGIKCDLVPDITLGLAGGVGFQGEICGVITGSAMVISLAIARKETDYDKKKMAVLTAVGQFHKSFKEKFGCTDCRTLSGLDLTTPEGKKKLAEGVKANVCSNFVKEGAKLLAQKLQTI